MLHSSGVINRAIWIVRACLTCWLLLIVRWMSPWYDDLCNKRISRPLKAGRATNRRDCHVCLQCTHLHRHRLLREWITVDFHADGLQRNVSSLWEEYIWCWDSEKTYYLWFVIVPFLIYLRTDWYDQVTVRRHASRAEIQRQFWTPKQVKPTRHPLVILMGFKQKLCFILFLNCITRTRMASN